MYIKDKKWSSYCLQKVEDYINIKIENNNIFIELIKDSSIRLIIVFGVENNTCEKKIVIDWKQKWKGFNEYVSKPELNDIENKYYNKLFDYENKIAHEIGIYNLTDLYTIPLEIDYEVERYNLNYKSFVCNNITKNVNYVDYNSIIKNNNKNIIELFNKYFNNEEINNLDKYVRLDIKESWNDNRIDYINKYLFYGIEIKYDALYLFKNEKKKINLDLMFFIPIKKLNLLDYKGEINLSQEQIKF